MFGEDQEGMQFLHNAAPFFATTIELKICDRPNAIGISSQVRHLGFAAVLIA